MKRIIAIVLTLTEAYTGKVTVAYNNVYGTAKTIEIDAEAAEEIVIDELRVYDLDATVTVSLSRDTIPVPEAVEVIWSGPGGNITELSGIIHKDLGIPKENQTWKRKN